MAFADAHAQFLVVADATPGRIDGIRGAVFIVGGQDKGRPGIGLGLSSAYPSFCFIMSLLLTTNENSSGGWVVQSLLNIRL